MKFGAKYVKYELNDDQLKLIEHHNNDDDQSTNLDNFSSRSKLLDDPKLFQTIWDIGSEFNRLEEKGGWKLDIKGLEPIELVNSSSQDFSSEWMLDNSRVDNFNVIPPDMVRKISAFIFLNDEYDGGEFDIELNGPSHEIRYKTLNKTKGSLILFQSDFWYRIRPIKSGNLKYLRTSFIGPSYK